VWVVTLEDAALPLVRLSYVSASKTTANAGTSEIGTALDTSKGYTGSHRDHRHHQH